MKKLKLHTVMPLFLVATSFFAGAFYVFFAFPITAFLAGWLVLQNRKNDGLRFGMSSSMIAVVSVVLFYGLTAFWAIDRGMAWWGFIKHIPLWLYALVLMQLEREARKELLCLIPGSGVIMTLVGAALQFVPVLQMRIAPNGQFAGFFEYPNTYALYMLIGIVHILMEEEIKPKKLIYLTVLMVGILFSGSRTTGILLVFAVGVIMWVRKDRWLVLKALGPIAVAVLVYLVIDWAGIRQESTTGISTGTDASTLIVRWLYYKDALKVILAHPFGLGYLGYSYLQGSVQTSVYHVTYVHNELLQLLLDIGWIPVAVLLIALGKNFFRKGTDWRKRLLMIVILGHCMMDFDLQFLTIWFILLSLMGFEGKQQRTIHPKGMAVTCCCVALATMLWLCASDFCFQVGWNQVCLKLTPFHTSALTRELPDEADTTVLDDVADRVLKLNKYVSLAYSAKANAAYARGDILSVMENKKQAVLNNRYVLGEYLDYFDKLYTIMELYKTQGDAASAEICRQRLMEIPEMLQHVLDETDPLAWRIKHKPELTLPQDYINILQQLQS